MSGNVKKIVILVVLLLAVPLSLWYATRPSAEQKAASERWAQLRAARNEASQTQPGAKSGTAQKPGPDAVASEFDVSEVDIPALLRNIQDVEFEYSLERLNRDPMSPLIGLQMETAATGSSQPMLGADQRLLQTARLKSVSGIVWDDRIPYAVIDNEVVTEGYAYPEGILLDEIHPDHVVFRVNDTRVEVELKEQ